MIKVVAGHKGRLGSWLHKKWGYAPLDCPIHDPHEVAIALEVTGPEVLVNAAAYTDVDRAEDEQEMERAIRANVRGPFVLRREFDGYLIHLSTGYVFDGRLGPYAEGAELAPINAYGFTKMGGEAGVMMGRAQTLVVRTLDLYGPSHDHSDFVKSVVVLLRAGKPFTLPRRLYGNPTYIPHLAEALDNLAERRLRIEHPILHVAGRDVMSRFEFGRMIAETFGYNPDLISKTDEIKGAASRPLAGGLVVQKAVDLSVPIYTAQEGLDALKAAYPELSADAP